MNPGDHFGDYTVVRLLGRGGMGEVWLLEGKSGRQVAAKILEATSDHESRKRFLREAQLALGVKHPNLVETYDVGEDPETGLCYILMEYVPGGTLADYLKEHGALAVEDAVAVVEAIAGVLELGRQKGIVHRDIKPANIMFDEEGTPKLADLGIARGGAAGTETTTVTQTGTMIGTPAYMSPEQMLDAHNVDTRADIYSLGVVFFEMLTGERPNKDDTVVQLLAKAVKGEPLPDVRTLRPEVSASLAQLLNMMVAPDKEGRISTPGQITSALAIIERGGAFKDVRSPSAPPPPSRGFPKWPIPVLALAALAGAFFALAPKKDRTAVVHRTESAAEKGRTNVVQIVVERTNTVESAVRHEKVVPVKTAHGIPDGSYTENSPQGEWTYHVSYGKAWLGGDGKLALYPQPSGLLKLPASLNGVPVKGIDKRAFYKCADLREVEIPEGYEVIGKGAFEDCGSLEKITLPKSMNVINSLAVCGTKIRSLDLNRISEWNWIAIVGTPCLEEISFDPRNTQFVVEDGMVMSKNRKHLLFVPRGRTEPTIPSSVTFIHGQAFGQGSIRSLVIPKNVRELYMFAASRCGSLRSLTIGSGVRKIGKRAFEFATNLTELNFEEGIRNLDEWAVFFNCSSLRTVKLPDSLETLGPGIFERNAALEEIHFGRSLKRIGYRAFRGDVSLKSVWLPESVCEMCAECFRGCSSLRRVGFDGDAPRLVDNEEGQRGVDVFMGTPSDLVVCVKRGSRGWNPDGNGLPDRWPVGAGNNARQIRYADELGSAAEEKVADAAERREIDPNLLRDLDTTKQARNALRVLFPGWMLATGVLQEDNEELGSGFHRQHRGRRNVALFHPVNVETPAVLRRSVELGKKPSCLVFETASRAADTDFIVSVLVDGKEALPPRLICTPDESPWERIVVPLSRWKGRRVKIELVLTANNWFYEHAYLSRIEIVEGTGKETCGPVGIASTEVFPRANLQNKKWLRRSSWAYTMREPPSNWNEADFDESRWRHTKKALGLGRGDDMAVADTWQSERIWIRRKFQWGDARPVYKAVFDLYYDQDIDVYLNGVKVLNLGGWNQSWVPYAARTKAFASALRRGENVLAITLKGDMGANYFDCGLTIETRQ